MKRILELFLMMALISLAALWLSPSLLPLAAPATPNGQPYEAMFVESDRYDGLSLCLRGMEFRLEASSCQGHVVLGGIWERTGDMIRLIPQTRDPIVGHFSAYKGRERLQLGKFQLDPVAVEGNREDFQRLFPSP